MGKRINFEYILVQTIFYVTVSGVFGFGTYTLLNRGYKVTEIGFLIAIANLASIGINYLASNLIDHNYRINVLNMSLGLGVISLFSYGINYFYDRPSLIVSVSFVIYFALVCAISPLVDSLSSVFIKRGININYGMARAFGSLSYGIASISYGYIAQNYSYKEILMVMVIFQIVLLLIIMIMGYQFKDINEDEKDKASGNYFDFIKVHHRFIFACIGYAGLLASFSLVMESFILPIVLSVGGSNIDSGNVQGIKAFIEVPIIFGFSLIEKRFESRKIFMVAIISFILKGLIMFFSTSILPIYLSQLLQCTSFALLLPGFISYINKSMNKDEIARAFAIQAILLTIFQMLLNFIGGYVLDIYGVKALCLLSVVISIISSYILMASISKDIK